MLYKYNTNFKFENNRHTTHKKCPIQLKLDQKTKITDMAVDANAGSSNVGIEERFDARPLLK